MKNSTFLNTLKAPVLVLGANGQVGSALVRLLGEKGIGWGREEGNLEEIEPTLAHIKALKPAAIINAAAYTQVDKAEEEEDRALLINATAPAAIAHYCKEHSIPFVHYSTDYVFKGDSTRPYVETDAIAPCNAYGRTKYEGEKAIREVGGKWLIFRTSWVYDAYGKNFLNTMLRLGKERETLRVVHDQQGAPTYAPELAKATLEALAAAENSLTFPSDIYHLSGAGLTTWHDFAVKIFDLARAHGETLAVKEIHPILASDYPTPAVRPHYSKLNGAKAHTTLGVTMRDWQEALNECMEQKYENVSLSA